MVNIINRSDYQNIQLWVSKILNVNLFSISFECILANTEISKVFLLKTEGNRFILKIGSLAIKNEIYAYDLLSQTSIWAIPRVYGTLIDNHTCLILLEYILGEIYSERPNANSILEATKSLATLQNDVSNYIQSAEASIFLPRKDITNWNFLYQNLFDYIESNIQLARHDYKKFIPRDHVEIPFDFID
jgi:hypothetical protein